MNLEKLSWSQPRKVETKRGERLVRSVDIGGNHEFWDLWKEKGGELKQLGFTVGKYREQWTLTQWIEPDKEIVIPSFDDVRDLEPETLSEYVEIPPEISSKMLPFQLDSVRQIYLALRDYAGALDCSDLGSGKSYVAMAACRMLGLKPFIICPKAVIPGWRNVLAHFDIEASGLINYEMLKTGNTLYGKWNDEDFQYSMPVEKTLLIFDEAQKCKAMSSKNTKMAVSAIKQGYKILAVSATIAQNPTEMRFSGHVAGLHKGDADFYRWMNDNGVVKGRFGLFFTGGAPVLKSIHHKIFPRHGSRIRIQDVPDFPETQIKAEAFDCGENTSEIEGVYNVMMNNLAELEVSTDKSLVERKASQLAEIMKARRASETLKIPAIVEMTEDFLENDKSVVIFTNFTDSLAKLKELLKTDCVIDGSTSLQNREKALADFQSDKERVIIVNIQSGGAGLSLHDLNGRHARVSIICPSWSALDMKQATGRIHRAGAKTKSFQYIFFAAGTIEDEICKKVRRKIENISSLNDGDLHPRGLF